MAGPYSMDLRLRVMAAVQSGLSYGEVVERFRVSNSSIIRWARRLRETGSFAALPMGGKKPFVLSEQREWMQQRLASKPDLTLRALLGELHERDIKVSYFALWHLVRRAGLSFKKRPSTPASRIVPMSRADANNGAAIKAE
jgi:transposase